jgi:hypothetical protein
MDERGWIEVVERLAAKLGAAEFESKRLSDQLWAERRLNKELRSEKPTMLFGQPPEYWLELEAEVKRLRERLDG